MSWRAECNDCAISFPGNVEGLAKLLLYLQQVPDPDPDEVLKRGGRLEPCARHRRLS